MRTEKVKELEKFIADNEIILKSAHIDTQIATVENTKWLEGVKAGKIRLKAERTVKALTRRDNQ
jgi:hypothetical protein